MKRVYILTIIFFALSGITFGQVVFEDTFDYSDGSLASNGWTTYNYDDVPSTTVWGSTWKISSFSNWNHFAGASARDVQADNWLISPQIFVPASSPYLRYTMWCLSGFGDETYQIRISTTDTDTSSFNILNTFIVSTTENNAMPIEIDLSAYAGDNVFIGFQHISNDQDIICLGDMIVGGSNPADLALTKINIEDYYLTSTDNTLNIRVKNVGTESVTSYDLSWKLDGGSIITQNVSGINITAFEESNIDLENTFNLLSAENHVITAWVSNINGAGSDPNVNNDTLSIEVAGVSQIPEKVVFIEEGTGVECGGCASGAEELDNLVNTYDNLVAVAYHNFGEDPMHNANTLPFTDAYFVSYPSASIDRIYNSDADQIAYSRGDWEDEYLTRSSKTVPVSIDLTSSLDANTRELTIEVSATFYSALDKDFRLNAYVVEDEVTGGPEYDQTDYSHPDWVQVGFVHQHVLREVLGGCWGEENSISSPTSDSQTYNTSFSYTVSSEYDLDQIYVVGFVQEYNEDELDRPVLNSKEVHPTIITNNSSIEKNNFNVYPNPTRDYIYIENNEMSEANINIIGIDGKVFKSKRINSKGNIIIDVHDFQQGLYILEMQTLEQQIIRKKIMIE